MAVLEELDIDRPTPEERDSHYKPGSIKRVKLKNFLTYDAVEFTPGPRWVIMHDLVALSFFLCVTWTLMTVMWYYASHIANTTPSSVFYYVSSVNIAETWVERT